MTKLAEMTVFRSVPTSVAVLLGLVATVLIGWGGTHPESSFGPNGWPNAAVQALATAVPIPLNRIVIVVGAVLLAYAWWMIRPHDEDEAGRRSWLVFGLWSLPLLLVPPTLSGDAVAYADAGWITHLGGNIYLDGYGSAGGPYASLVDELWTGSGVAYPPLSLLVNQAVVMATGFHPYWGIVAMRVPALLGTIAMGAFGADIAVRLGHSRAWALWWGLLNPLTLVHFVGGAHNDALMVGTSMLAVWLVVRFPTTAWLRWLVAPIVVGVAMALKQQAGLTVLAVAGLPVAGLLQQTPLPRRLWILGWRTAVVTVVAVATFVGISLASGLDFGWVKWMSSSGTAGTPAPFGIIRHTGRALLEWQGMDAGPYQAAVGLISTVVMLAALAWIVIRWSDRPLTAIGWGSLAFSVLGQALHPWYVVWSYAVLGLMPLDRRPRRFLLWFAVVFLVWNAFQTVTRPVFGA